MVLHGPATRPAEHGRLVSATTGQWNSWNTHKSVAGGNTTTYVANMEYLWYQNGVPVGQQVTRATHVAASSGAIGGNSCLWYEWVWIPLR